jgi:hypothetical protein
MRSLRLMLAILLALSACGDSTDIASLSDPINQPGSDPSNTDTFPGNTDRPDLPIGHQIEARLSPSLIEAGETSQVSCTVYADNGETIDTTEWTFSLVVPSEVTADHSALTVTSEQAGNYPIRCATSNASNLIPVDATLTVTAATPVSVALTVTPDSSVYDPGDKITFTWTAFDAFGNPIEDLDGAVTGPASGVTPLETPHGYEFIAEGVHVFNLALAAPHANLTDQMVLLCDETAPELSIKTPERGATLQGNGEAIAVIGTVSDAVSDVASVTVNGTPVTLTADGGFTASVTPSWGLNVIVVEATDIHGFATTFTPTFHYASTYRPFVDTNAEGVSVADGMKAFLSQRFLDDGDHDPNHPNDLATIVGTVLSNMEVSDLSVTSEPIHLEYPLLDETIEVLSMDLNIAGTLNLDIHIEDSTDIGPTTLSLDSRDGGIDLGMMMGDDDHLGLQVDIRIDATFPITVSTLVMGLAVSTTATAYATTWSGVTIDALGIVMDMDIAMATGGALNVVTHNTDFTLEGLLIDPIEDLVFGFAITLPFVGDLDFDLTMSDYFDLTTITDSLLDPITASLMPALIDMLEPVIATVAGGFIEDAIEGFAVEETFELPQVMGFMPKTVELYTALSSIGFTEEGGTIGLDLGVWSDQGIQRDPLGAIVRDGCFEGSTPSVGFDWDRALGVAPQTDALNAIMFATWWSGYFEAEMELTDQLSGLDTPMELDSLDASFRFLLPPIINDCNANGDLAMEIGDLEMDMSMGLAGIVIEAQIYVDAIVAVGFEAQEDGVVIVVQDVTFLDIEVGTLSQEYLGYLSLRELFDEAAVGLMTQQISGLTIGPIALPGLSLDTMLPGLPEGAQVSLDGFTASKHPGYSLFALDVN